MHEQTVLAEFGRPMDISERGETTSERQRGTVGDMRMAYWGKETTAEVGWGKGRRSRLVQNNQLQKRQTRIGDIQRRSNGPRLGLEMIPKERIPKEKTSKERIDRKGFQRKRPPKEGAPEEKIPKEG